jgi:hypothetical protein
MQLLLVSVSPSTPAMAKRRKKLKRPGSGFEPSCTRQEMKALSDQFDRRPHKGVCHSPLEALVFYLGNQVPVAILTNRDAAAQLS